MRFFSDSQKRGSQRILVYDVVTFVYEAAVQLPHERSLSEE
jgi:hypothetical protein